MRWLIPVSSVFFLVFLIVTIMSSILCAFAHDTIAQNFTERSKIFVIGYVDESRIYQTEKGFEGTKMVLSTRGSGIADRTIDSQVYADSNMAETSLKVSAIYDYRPYTPPLVFTQSDLKNALCAKNYEVGSVYSESYSNLKDLIKDTKIYQDDNTSIYDIDSELQGVARIGSRVKKNAHTVPTYIMGGTYIGYVDIRSEMQAGNMSIMNLPCP
ncbi:MAG: hypothetical protein LUQ38_00200 [Methanotrichaceae archaeon]|nr:hypothetical protein [Methanotrichaceae archaeon]